MANLSINYAGLNLSSPIIVASSGLTESVNNIKEIEESGAGAVVLKSIFEEEILMEMEQIKQKNIDKEGKIAIIGKDVIKTNIGRSPDEWDSIMMRYYFELEPKMFMF